MYKKLVVTGLVVILVLALVGCRQEREAPAVEYKTTAANSEKLSQLDDIAGKRVGVVTGTLFDGFVAQKYPQAKIHRFDSTSDMVMAIKTNKLEAAIVDAVSAKEVQKKDQNIGILSDDVLSYPMGIGFNKNNPALREKFNNFLKEARASGTYDEIYQRWFVNDPELAVMPDIKNNARGDKLVLGVSVADLPYVAFMNGKYVGFDIEMVQNFAVQKGYNLEIVTMEFASLIAALSSGKVDMIADGIGITEERSKQVDFSDSYVDGKTAVIALKSNLTSNALSNDDHSQLKTVDDLKDKKIGVLLGGIHDDYARKTWPQAAVMQYKSQSDLILAVKTGKVDAAFYTHESLLEMLRSDKDLAFLGQNLFRIPIAMGFNKNNDELREQFNQFLKQSKANGVFDDMVKRWITEGKTEMPVIKNPKDQGRLVVGIVSDKGLPFAIVKNNRVVGFDIEIAERFAAYLGKELVLADMEFASLISAAAGNKIDMIDSTLVITEERAKQVDFSDPYYELGASVFTLKKNLAAYAGQSNKPAAPSFMQGIADSFHNNMIVEQRYLLIVDGLKITIIISLLSVIFGTLLGALICFMRMAKNRLLSAIARVYISILRGTPVLVLLMIIFYIVFASVNIDPVLVAVIAFGMNFGAYVSEMFRTAIESVDRGQTEAGIASGFTPLQTFIHIIMPQAVRQVLPVYKGEFISMVKMTSVVGYIAVQDLTKASDIIRSRTFDAFFPLLMVAVLYFVISWLLALVLDYIGIKTDPKRNRNIREASV
ncbi:MAG: ABC transporter substrate-binding protein/permease [Syntrophomonas sp.]